MKELIIKIYGLERKCRKTGLIEHIEAWRPCKGWKTIYIKQCKCIDGHIVEC